MGSHAPVEAAIVLRLHEPLAVCVLPVYLGGRYQPGVLHSRRHHSTNPGAWCMERSAWSVVHGALCMEHGVGRSIERTCFLPHVLRNCVLHVCIHIATHTCATYPRSCIVPHALCQACPCPYPMPSMPMSPTLCHRSLHLVVFYILELE